MSELKTACAYIRVSTDKQDEYSPDAQKRLIQEYAQKNGYILTSIDIFEDIGISGRKANKRDGFKDMIAACKSKEHPYDAVLIWKFSRFARNQEESIVYKNLLKKSNVEVISISEPIPEGFIGELVQRIFEWMDEYYSIRLSGEVKRGMTQKAMIGEYCGKVPYGYEIKDKKLIINQNEAPIVNRIFNLFLQEDMSIIKIAKILNSEGVISPGGMTWHSVTVKKLLINEKYIGTSIWNQTHYEDGKAIMNDKENWIIKENTHKPIVSKELFDKVQTKLQQITQSHAPRDPEACGHWLTGTLICSGCGKPLNYRRENRYNNHTNPAGFRCRRYAQGSCPTQNYINAQKIENEVLDFLKSINADNLPPYKKVAKKEDFDKVSYLTYQLEDLYNKQKRIKNAYINGIDTLDEYEKNKSTITAEIEKISKELALELEKTSADKSEKDNLTMLNNITDVIKVITSDRTDKVTKANAIRTIFEKIVVNRKENTIEYHLKL